MWRWPAAKLECGHLQALAQPVRDLPRPGTGRRPGPKRGSAARPGTGWPGGQPAGKPAGGGVLCLKQVTQCSETGLPDRRTGRLASLCYRWLFPENIDDAGCSDGPEPACWPALDFYAAGQGRDRLEQGKAARAGCGAVGFRGSGGRNWPARAGRPACHIQLTRLDHQEPAGERLCGHQRRAEPARQIAGGIACLRVLHMTHHRGDQSGKMLPEAHERAVKKGVSGHHRRAA